MTHHLGQRDLDWADAFATPAKRRGVRQVSGLAGADESRCQYSAHRPRSDPAIGMAADCGVDRAVIHARRTPDTAQHILEFRADHSAAAIVEQNQVVLLGAIEIIRPAWPSRNRRVARAFLTPCR